MYEQEEIEAVIGFWFAGDREARKERWWKKSPEVDQWCQERFGSLFDAAVRGDLDAWLDSPRGRQAFVILCDQIARNMHRGTARMYACDDKAQAAVERALAEGDDRHLDDAERQFLYMPLMHSERLDHQERAVTLFRQLALGGVIDSVKWAVQHRDIVARFGRFPHRNQILGRPSTPEELEFLQQPGSSF